MSKIKQITPHIIFILIYIMLVVAIRFQPLTQTFEFDYDEGINLIKANIFSQGLSLYGQTWNDQPPFLTILLSFWLKLFGQSIIAARLLVLFFSALLAWSFFQIVKRDINPIVATIATFLLFTSWLFIRLSISVMIGLPAISLMMLAIYLIKYFQTKKQLIWLCLSGIFMGLSLQTKLFTIILFPFLILEIINYKQINNITNITNHRPINRKIYLVLFWLMHVLIIYLTIGTLTGYIFNHEQTVISHLVQPKQTTIENFKNHIYLQYMLRQDWDYLFLACLGIVAIIKKPQQQAILPMGWCAIACIFLFFHRPIWYHHYTLLIIPVCWLAAYAIDAFLKFVRTYPGTPKLNLFSPQRIYWVSAVLVFMFLVAVTPPVSRGKPPKDMQVMQLVRQHQNNSQWIFTDRPMYAFSAGLSVPPEIAVLSYKRINSGNFSPTEMLAVLQKYRPQQIVLARWVQTFAQNPQIMNYIQANYNQIYRDRDGNVVHYLRQQK